MQQKKSFWIRQKRMKFTSNHSFEYHNWIPTIYYVNYPFALNSNPHRMSIHRLVGLHLVFQLHAVQLQWLSKYLHILLEMLGTQIRSHKYPTNFDLCHWIRYEHAMHNRRHTELFHCRRILHFQHHIVVVHKYADLSMDLDGLFRVGMENGNQWNSLLIKRGKKSESLEYSGISITFRSAFCAQQILMRIDLNSNVNRITKKLKKKTTYLPVQLNNLPKVLL